MSTYPPGMRDLKVATATRLGWPPSQRSPTAGTLRTLRRSVGHVWCWLEAVIAARRAALACLSDPWGPDRRTRPRAK